MMLEVTHGLDMQVPTLLMGDYNGAVDPPQDFLSVSGHRREVCPLLARLLGPGGAWVDVHRALLGEVPWTFRSLDSANTLSASRIDLILANHAAMALVQTAAVLESICDGGHSPVLVNIRLDGPVALDWTRPRPRLPPLFFLGSVDLHRSADWASLISSWLQSPSALQLTPSTTHTTASLSAALVSALQSLVTLAGGWDSRPPHRRLAYDSDDLRAARRALALLQRISSLLHSAASMPPGPWPRLWMQYLRRLSHMGFSFPQCSAVSLAAAIHTALASQRTLVCRLTKEMRQARHRL